MFLVNLGEQSLQILHLLARASGVVTEMINASVMFQSGFQALVSHSKAFVCLFMCGASPSARCAPNGYNVKKIIQM